MESRGVVDQRLEDKLDKVFEEIKEMGKVVAVQEQKLREINHRMGDGQQRNEFGQGAMRAEINKRLDHINTALDMKVDIAEYKETLREIRDTLTKYQKSMIVISTILVTGSGLVANMPDVKKLILYIFGAH